MSSSPRKASSANEGFFQALPVLENQFHDDPSFQRVLKLFLPKQVLDSISPDLSSLGQKVLSKQILDWVTDAERNVPYLNGGGRDALGRRTSELVVGEGWRELQRFGIENGIVATGYEGMHGEYTRVAQFLKTQLWTGSCANVTCPSAMTDGAAKLLSSHLSMKDLDPTTRTVFQDAYDRITSRKSDFAWTSGQWMTERSGGSDVSGTETVATYSPTTGGLSASRQPLGPWSIDGFKWFSSATDSSMTILLAQTSKGLSAFFAPMRRQVDGSSTETELNGVHIQRLKNKSGTKSLPTAELELRGMRGYLIGKEGQGIQEISTILNITRLYSAVGTIGYVGRGLAIAKSFTRVREVGAGRGKRVKLYNAPLHMSTLAKLTGEYHAMMLFTFFVAWLIGINEHGHTSEEASSRDSLRPDTADIPHLLRLLTPILKGSVCKRSSHVLQECMEALGGVGYLDNSENEAINIARLYRDCIVNSIWEGTTDVLATDTLRVLKGHSGGSVLKALNQWISKALFDSELRDNSTVGHAKIALVERWETLMGSILDMSSDELLPLARDLLFQISDIIMGVLLFVDLQRDESPASTLVFLRFLEDKGIARQDFSVVTTNPRKLLDLNKEIVFGKGAASLSAAQAKL